MGDDLLTRGVGGSIINMSSQMGTVGYPGRAAYCATKHAVEGLTKALGVEWAPTGIRVNAVAPTFVVTPLTKPMFDDPEFAAEVRRRTADGRAGNDRAGRRRGPLPRLRRVGSVTGTILRVDGGWTAWCEHP